MKAIHDAGKTNTPTRGQGPGSHTVHDWLDRHLVNDPHHGMGPHVGHDHENARAAGFPLFTMLAPLAFLALLNPAWLDFDAQQAGPVLDEPAQTARVAAMPGEPIGAVAVTGTGVPGAYEESVLERAVASPGSVAVDARNGNIFVADRDAGCIRLITRPGGPVVIDGRIPVRGPSGPSASEQPPLAGAESIEFVEHDAGGVLYVSEGAPGSRVIAFDVNEDGVATSGVVQ
jgi:hypothetical protein